MPENCRIHQFMSELIENPSWLHPLRAALAGCRLCVRRLLLRTGPTPVAVPLLRSVWGAALHELDSTAYHQVFHGEGADHERQPAYVLRPAARDEPHPPALEWLTWGPGLAHDDVLCRAWDRASGMGLGKQRERFVVHGVRMLTAAGAPAGAVAPWPEARANIWTLEEAVWPLPGPPGSTPCRLNFAAPLRLIRQRTLVLQPTLPDVVAACIRRLRLAVPAAETQALLDQCATEALQAATQVPAGQWRGSHATFHRYSARQDREIDHDGTIGSIDLPEGPGALWPLLLVGVWLHVGKTTVHGLGQMTVEPL
jgi:hypothetical protein